LNGGDSRGGITPITSHDRVFNVIVSPTIVAREPNRVCHSSWLMMHTAGRQVLRFREIAAERRQDAERRQERRAHAQAVQLLGVAVAGEREVVERREADRRKRVRLRRDGLVMRPRNRRCVQIQLRVVRPDGDERVGLRDRDGVENQPVVYRKERRVGVSKLTARGTTASGAGHSLQCGA